SRAILERARQPLQVLSSLRVLDQGVRGRGKEGGLQQSLRLSQPRVSNRDGPARSLSRPDGTVTVRSRLPTSRRWSHRELQPSASGAPIPVAQSGMCIQPGNEGGSPDAPALPPRTGQPERLP